MTRRKTLTIRLSVTLPRVMAEDVEFIRARDGRSLAELVRSLLAQLVKDAREKIVTHPKH